ncbi:MAG: B12-binding domain-containing radical SAM protein [Elusimicrobia bacterium CG06_land_8_20_14_3_00_38_11]|nr:MAG: B12-binding domain-containing radical SAM protein [Elusimicrobia bacterium CG06_land_8_20_14_3_00_38_11]
MDLEKFLPFVKKPAQYIGQEWNSTSHFPLPTSHLRFCLVFPDLYEIGMSNLGLQIIYNILNKTEFVVCERAFSPAADMETLLRKNNLPLFSIETKTPLNEFDIIGFNIQHELCYTNILNILDLAKIPLKTKDRMGTVREGQSPLIIAGGPACVNPLPISEFIDAFVIGDGEDIITQITNYKLQITNKNDLLKKLSEIPSVYVPSFHNGKRTIKKNIVDLESAQFPTNPVVPFLNVIQNRLNVEIMRGCGRGCFFCQASKLYSPRRLRSKEKILEIIEKGLASTGYDEISLLSLSTSDYPKINELMDDVLKVCVAKKVAVALPSLRCHPSSVDLAAKTRVFKKTSLTFAPEAGTERLRKHIGKFITDAEILETTNYAYKSGWRLLKLYFMLGLPSETDEDIEGIVSIVRSIKKQTPLLNLNITISPFVPKPHTVFEREKFFGTDYFNEKRIYLKKKLPAEVKSHKPEMSTIEAIFARGDEKLCSVLEMAYKNGCKFDNWNEFFSYEKWLDAFSKCGVNPDGELKEIEKSKALPWDFIEL